MGKVQGNWLTGAHSGRACKHDDIYTKINKKTGACCSVKLCNPSHQRNEAQQKVMSTFARVSKAVNEWLGKEKVAQSDDFMRVKTIFDRQSRYATLRGMMISKGMYKVGADGTITVDVDARTNFKTLSGSIQLPEGGSANSPAAPAEKFTLTLTASPSVGGSVTGAGQYAKGAQATIKATAKSGYTFTRWSDGNTNAERTLTISGDLTLQAIFTANSGSGESQPGGGSEVGAD